jgi:cell division protein FtsB
MTNIDWNGYIDRARAVAVEAEELWTAHAPQLIDTNDHRRRVTYGLRLALLVEYHATLILLRDPFVAYAGEALLRGSLEAWAHLAWIEWGEPKSNRRGKQLKSKTKTNHCMSDNRRSWSTRETRALCWCMGDASWFHKNVAAAHASVKERRVTRQARDRAKRFRGLHMATGCPGVRGRDQGDVQAMLVLIARKYHLPWAPALWRAYSATAHQGTPIRLNRRSPGGSSEGRAALSTAERRALLVRNVTVFLNAYQLVLFLSTDSAASWYEFQTRVAVPATALNAELNALPLE